MRGRKPKPTQILKLQGTFQPCRRTTDEPKPDVCNIEPPSFLEGAALAEFQRLAPSLKDKGCLSQWDVGALAGYCHEYGLYVDACKAIKSLTVQTEFGAEKVNPLIVIKNAAFQNFMKAAVEFGLTPSSRSRVKADRKQVADPFEKLMQRKIG